MKISPHPHFSGIANVTYVGNQSNQVYSLGKLAEYGEKSNGKRWHHDDLLPQISDTLQKKFGPEEDPVFFNVGENAFNVVAYGPDAKRFHDHLKKSNRIDNEDFWGNLARVKKEWLDRPENTPTEAMTVTLNFKESSAEISKEKP